MATTKPFIAVVDDDRSVVKSLTRTLRSAGYEVGPFGSPQEFLSSLGAAAPQCLVLDVHMPGMTGLELHCRLRELGHQMPVIFITAHDMPQIHAAASQAGVVALLFKPFGNPALLRAVQQAVGSGEARKTD